MIRILLADKHPVVRQGLMSAFVLAQDMEAVAEAESGEALVRHLNGATKFDLLLLDMDMADIGGIRLVERVKACRKSLPVLIFSAQSDLHTIIRVIRAGVAGYLSKDQQLESIVGAIRKVAGGGRYIDPRIAEEMAFAESTAAQPVPLASLSDRELEVFKLLISGLRINEIAAKLFISDKTASSHKKHLMEKMHVSSMVELMRYAVQLQLFEPHEGLDKADVGDIAACGRQLDLSSRAYGDKAGNDGEYASL
ncbi:MAG TPA: response regulator transcription factor [Sideroxyarcus sp.]|nr:response regulator transcription factor [Sideroxyarcus sp.]